LNTNGLVILLLTMVKLSRNHAPERNNVILIFVGDNFNLVLLGFTFHEDLLMTLYDMIVCD